MSIQRLSWLVGITVILLASILWLMTDAPLNAKASAAINLDDHAITNDNGFIFLLGFDTPKGDDSYSTGKNRLLQYRQWLKNPTVMAAPTFNGVHSIRAPLWFDGSDEKLIAHAKDIPYVIASNPNLYSRYHAFLQFKEFDTLIRFDSQTTEDISEGLSLGNRCLQADVLSQALTNSAPQAAALLIEDVNAWRKQLQLADNMSHKLFAARILAKDFSLMVTLAQKNVWSLDNLTLLINTLMPLSLQEVSIEKPLLHAEFSKQGYALLEAKKNPALINISQDGFWPLVFSYKPNMTINFLYEQYTKIASENNLPPRQLFSTMQQQNIREFAIPLNAWLKNLAGIKVVQNLLTADFISYTARFWDVDVNRLLTRLVLEASYQQINTEDALTSFIQNPKYRGIWDNKPPHYSPDKTQLCYDGPAEDKKMLRCIDIKWLLQKHS